MKKILTTVVVCFVVLISSNTVYAFTPADITPKYYDVKNRIQYSDVYEISQIPDFDYIANLLEKNAIQHFKNTREKRNWAICSLNSHKNLQFYIFYKESEGYKKIEKSIDESWDFVQVGGIIDKSDLEATREAFEKNPRKAALDAIIPASADINKKELYKSFKRNIPIYWNIKEHNSGIATLEVAIGRYVIRNRDTLSEIAMRYETTVEEIMYDNENIKNPDLIYEGDYLVIK